MAFEDILATIQDAEERGQFEALVGKYPTLKQYAEIGERVAPVIEKMPQGVDAYAEIERTPGWLKWRTEDWPAVQAQKLQVERERDEFKAKLTELQNKGEFGEMTFEEIQAKLAENGVLTKKDLEASGYMSRKDVEATLNQGFLHQQKVFAEINPLAQEYQMKFGKPMDVQKVFDWMTNNQRFDIKQQALVMPSVKDAYEAVIAPDVRAEEAKQIDAKLAAAREEGIKEGRQAAVQSLEGRGVPVAGQGKSMFSRFYNRVMDRRSQNPDNSGKLGSGQASRDGYNDYLKRQAAGGSL